MRNSRTMVGPWKDPSWELSWNDFKSICFLSRIKPMVNCKANAMVNWSCSARSVCLVCICSLGAPKVRCWRTGRNNWTKAAVDLMVGKKWRKVLIGTNKRWQGLQVMICFKCGSISTTNLCWSIGKTYNYLLYLYLWDVTYFLKGMAMCLLV